MGSSMRDIIEKKQVWFNWLFFVCSNINTLDSSSKLFVPHKIHHKMILFYVFLAFFPNLSRGYCSFQNGCPTNYTPNQCSQPCLDNVTGSSYRIHDEQGWTWSFEVEFPPIATCPILFNDAGISGKCSCSSLAPCRSTSDSCIKQHRENCNGTRFSDVVARAPSTSNTPNSTAQNSTNSSQNSTNSSQNSTNSSQNSTTPPLLLLPFRLLRETTQCLQSL